MNNDQPNRPKLDLELVNAKLQGKTGPQYWRGLEEIADTEEFQAWVEDEFPNRKDLAGLDRRSFLKFMGASMALAGLGGCRSVFMNEEHLVPYVKQPEEMVIGKPLYYATAMSALGYAVGTLVEQREGRPIKLEGNPDHPISNGAIDARTQAEILTMYDPDRLTTILNAGNVSTWEQFVEIATQAMAAQKPKKGSGLRILTETVTSPTLAAQIKALLALYPDAKWHVYEPVNRDNERLAAQESFGKQLDTHYDLSKARVIVTLDSDFLQDRTDSLKLARQFSDGRRVTGLQGSMNRLYAIESSVTITGGAADHRYPLKPSDVHAATAAIAAGLGLLTSAGPSPLSPKVVNAIVKDLQANRGACVVIPGAGQTPAVHTLAHAINNALGNLGQTVLFTAPIEANPELRSQGITTLTNDLDQGMVDAVVIIGGNPVLTAPRDIAFATALTKAKFKVHLGLYDDETGQACDWSLPMTHGLEMWTDLRAADGTVTICQPVTAPIHGDEIKSPHEFVDVLAGGATPGYDIIRGHYSKGVSKLDEKAFRKCLNDGKLPNSAAAILTAAFVGVAAPPGPGPTGGEIKFVPCPKIWDGRDSNNGWLRELPNPVTKVTWDNVIEISPQMAKREKIDSGNILELSVGGGATVAGPAWIQPGQPDGSITVTLGYGRQTGGAVATAEEATGFNAYPLRSSKGMGFSTVPVEIRNNGGDFRFANVQLHHAMEGRDIIRSGTLAELNEAVTKGEKPFRFADEGKEEGPLPSLYPDEVFEWQGEQWGMTIDLNTCIGCNACVMACQAENNIPVVGKDQVARGREMHWIRIDRYYGGNETYESAETADSLSNPTFTYQPVMCVHCEKAPCEPVCPVAATVHGHDGLNQMVYNRCVGTRYCSDNCPYKVRKFNFLNYTDNQTQFAEHEKIPLLRMLNNPDVTVRGRGVMEKCTYCVQRISEARIESKKAGIPIKDGTIITACQQACPTKTIVFGNVADKEAEVTKLRKDPRSYLLLEDLNTRPRTSHLARLRNPNPEIVA